MDGVECVAVVMCLGVLGDPGASTTRAALGGAFVIDISVAPSGTSRGPSPERQKVEVAHGPPVNGIVGLDPPAMTLGASVAPVVTRHSCSDSLCGLSTERWETPRFPRPLTRDAAGLDPPVAISGLNRALSPSRLRVRCSSLVPTSFGPFGWMDHQPCEVVCLYACGRL